MQISNCYLLPISDNLYRNVQCIVRRQIFFLCIYICMIHFFSLYSRALRKIDLDCFTFFLSSHLLLSINEHFSIRESSLIESQWNLYLNDKNTSLLPLTCDSSFLYVVNFFCLCRIHYHYQIMSIIKIIFVYNYCFIFN